MIQMTRQDSWSAKWACEKLISTTDVNSANAVGTNQIELTIKALSAPVLIATMSVDGVEAKDLEEVCPSNEFEFALNIKNDALYVSSALRFAESYSIGLGGLGDLYSAAHQKSFRTYLPKEVRFILQGLRQHTAVSSIERQNNRMYRVVRKTGKSMLVLALNDYDMTADTVRGGIDRFGHCDVILASNPNCRLSGESIAAAKSCGVPLLTWGLFLGALNH